MYSYKHFKINLPYVEDNKYSNNIQYYRTLLQAHSIYLPSIILFKTIYSNNSNQSVFKARYISDIITKYIKKTMNFLKVYSHFSKLYKKIVNIRKIRKNIKYIIYKRNNRYKKNINKNQILFIIRLKHFLLLAKNKCRKRIRKNRYYLWKSFYSIPDSFWNISIKKRLKSLIWTIISNNNNNNLYYKKLPNFIKKKKNKIKGNAYYYNFNKMSNLIFKVIKKKRLPSDIWKLKNKKNRMNKKFVLHKYKGMLYKYYLNNIKNRNYIYLFNNNKISISNNTINTINFFIRSYNIINYYKLLYFIKNNSLFYKYLSFIYKNSMNKYILSDINNIKLKAINIINSNITFNIHKWYNLFMMDREVNILFNINTLLSNIIKIKKKYNIKIYKKSNLLSKFIIFFYRKNNNIKNITINKYNIKINMHKNNNFINNNFINNNIYNITKKNKKWNKYFIFNNLYNFRKKTHHIQLINNRKKYKYNLISKKYLLFIKNKIKKNIINNIYIDNNIYNKILLRKSKKKKYIYKKFLLKNIKLKIKNNKKNNNNILHASTINKVIINNLIIYKLYKKYKSFKFNINLNNLYNSNYIKNNNFIIFKYIKNNKIIYINNLIYNKKINLNTTNFLYDNRGILIRIINKNNNIYNNYFNNINLYKEIIIEYYIRTHYKLNEYERSFMRNGSLSYYNTKTKNVSNIKNGIYLINNIIYNKYDNKPILTQYDNKLNKVININLFNMFI